jgi:hypothetical protein
MPDFQADSEQSESAVVFSANDIDVLWSIY